MRAPKSARTPRANFYQVDGNDWLLGTETISLAAQGAYMRLLLQQWRDRNVLRSPDAARHVAHASEAEWPAIWAELAEHFPADADGFLRNRRCERERARVKAISKKRSLSGSKGGRPKTAKQPESKCYPNENQSRGEEEEEEETPTESSPSSPPSVRPAPLDEAARIDAAFAADAPHLNTPDVRGAFEALEAARAARRATDRHAAGRRNPEQVRAWLGKWRHKSAEALLAMLRDALAAGWQDVREPEPRAAVPSGRNGHARAGQSGRDLIAQMVAELPDYPHDPLNGARAAEVLS